MSCIRSATPSKRTRIGGSRARQSVSHAAPRAGVAQRGKPVEDRAREELVIKKAKERARQAGLDPTSIEVFFHTQISAAKVIQYRYLAEWALSRPPPKSEPRDLVTEVRPELIRLGKEIILAIRSFLESGRRLTDAHLSEFLTAINVSNLSQDEKRKLFESMRQIALSWA